jgi:Xaa-Pro aminopeptidase
MAVMSHTQRIQHLQQQLTDTALVISDPLDLYYLTDFVCLTPEEREAYLVLTSSSAHLFLSAFSTPTQVDGMHIHVGGIERTLKEKLPTIIDQSTSTVLQVDGNSLRVNEFEFFKSLLSPNIQLSTLTESPLTKQRIVKDELEIAALTKANEITHLALETTFCKLQVGMTELDVQRVLEQEMRDLGVKEFSFPTIVCFGKATAAPHHQPDNTQLNENMAILIDCGAKWQKYCADVTRTTWFGSEPDQDFSKLEETVKQAYALTFDTLKNRQGAITAADLDKVARDFINNAGFGQYFIHTTGHGVGLYIHESPSLNQRNTTEIKPGMVITIEPGIYLEGKFGFRFENSVLVTADSAKELV